MNRSVLVTGADRGLGSAIVREFLAAGDRVFAGQFLPEWGELAALQREFGEKLVLLPLDVSGLQSVRQAREQVEQHTGSLDILVNNAGISGGAGDISALERLDRGTTIFSTNSLGPLRMVNEFLPLLERGSDRLLCFVSSESGSVSVCHRTDGFLYPMSKTALNMAVKLLFEELNPKGYRFRLFHPGWVRSYMSGQKNTVGKFEPEESAASAYRYFTEPLRNENVLRLVDNEGAAWPF